MNTEKEEGIILTGYAEFALNEYRRRWPSWKRRASRPATRIP